jgi:hypothetical protein
MRGRVVGEGLSRKLPASRVDLGLLQALKGEYLMEISVELFRQREDTPLKIGSPHGQKSHG